MSMTDKTHLEQHSLLLKKRGQLMLTALLAFVIQSTPPHANAQGSERSGKDVVETVCAVCHKTGTHGAPKIGDREAWSKRASQGLTGLTQHALNGIREMPSHGGNPGLTDLEIGRAVTYMVNRSGGHWVEPLSAKNMAAERSGEQIVHARCANCHRNGVGGAPKIGDRDAWVPRLKQGLEYLVHSAIKGHGGMPPRGGVADLTDTEIRNAIIYMFNPVPAPASNSEEARNATAAAEARGAMADSNHKTVGGTEIFLGLVPAENILAYPEQSAERTMHKGVPKGAGYYHLNVSLFDRASKTPIAGAQVEVQLERAGMTTGSIALEPMAVGAGSYGNYFRVPGKGVYQIVVRMRSPGSSRTIEARFDHAFD
jgi:cytochrome c5